MTPKQRWLAALRLELVDRLPFWPKLGAAYAPCQQEPWRGRTNAQIHEWIGSDRHEWLSNCVREVRSHTTVKTLEENGVRRVIYRTPAGELAAEWRWDKGSLSWHPVVFPVKSVRDIEVMALVCEDARYEPDLEQLEQTKALVQEIGQSALLATTHGTSPLMDWVQHVAGVENGHYMLADHRGEVEGLFDAMHHVALRRLEVIAETTVADAVYSMENTSTTLISPAMYHRYCKDHVTDYGRMIEAAGKGHILHMCGALKDLLPDLAQVPACAFEAFTSAPVGNTSLADGRSVCLDTCLIGGTNAALWLRPAERIIRTIRRDLDALPHTRGIVITSAGVMPPVCPPESIKQVADAVKGFPVR